MAIMISAIGFMAGCFYFCKNFLNFFMFLECPPRILGDLTQRFQRILQLVIVRLVDNICFRAYGRNSRRRLHPLKRHDKIGRACQQRADSMCVLILSLLIARILHRACAEQQLNKLEGDKMGAALNGAVVLYGIRHMHSIDG